MANKIHIEPERLRKFASDLKKFRGTVDELTSRINGNLSRLSDSWRDQEFDKFKAAFADAQKKLRKFSAEAEQTVPKLERDARAAEEIHKIVLPK